MTKAKGKARTPKKGGSPSAETVKKSLDNPDAQTEEDLAEIFGSLEPEVLEEEEVTNPDDEQELVTPTLTPAGEEEEDNPDPEEDEEDEEEEKKTQAAGEEKEDEDELSSLDEATLIKLLPKKFQGEDLAKSIEKITGSYSELESAKDRKESELAQTVKILKGLGASPTPTPTEPTTKPAAAPATEAAPVITPEEEKALATALANIDVLEDPVSPLKNIYLLAKKAAAAEARNQLVQYDSLKTTVDQFNRFKTEHPDFDDLKPEMLEVIEANPHLDTPEAVGLVYDKAKELNMMRSTATTKETTDQVLGSDDFKSILEKVRSDAAKQAQQELLAKIKQGQAVKGTLESGSTQSPTPKDRTGEDEKKKTFRIQTDHGEFKLNDEELAGIITAEEHEDRGLLNL